MDNAVTIQFHWTFWVMLSTLIFSVTAVKLAVIWERRRR